MTKDIPIGVIVQSDDGFTLTEVLVAMGIFSILSLIGVSLTLQILPQKHHLDQKLGTTQSISLMHQILKKDLENLTVQRPLTIAWDKSQNLSFVLQPEQLEFLHQNGMQIRYHLYDSQFIRQSSSQDLTGAITSSSRPLLAGVQDIQWVGITQQGMVDSLALTPDDDMTGLQHLQLVIDFKDGKKLTQYFKIPELES